MNELGLSEICEKINSVFLNILYMKPEERMVTPNINLLGDLKALLNELFTDNECVDVMYTLNTDKQFFGVKINPMMTFENALAIMLTDEKVNISKYQVELDSKLFDCGLDSEELTATLLFEISSMMESYEAIDQVRALIDLHVLAEDDVISLRDSGNYTQLIIYALKDTLYKVTSITFKDDPEEIICNKLIQALSLEETVISAQQKIVSSVFGIGDSVREPKTIILRWMFMIYKDIKHNSNIIKDTLKEAKDFTASRLLKLEIDKTIKAVDNIRAQTIFEHVSINKFFDSKCVYGLNEISLFKSLKTKGLRSVEDTVYEIAIRIKNCSTEEDAMYILRMINTRLSIVEDYIYNTPDLSEVEKKHWEDVAMQYRALREQLSKKKIWDKKKFGLFMDYNLLDQLDKDEEYE